MGAYYYIKIYIATFLIFLGIDIFWLALIAPNFYKKYIGHLLAENPNLIAALAFYLLNIIGIMILAVLPSLNKGTWQTALIFGALYGLLTYATYDLTNLATLKDWPILVTIVDIIWGTVLTATVSTLGYFAATKLT
jgi:uncharacterized membrane protein